MNRILLLALAAASFDATASGFAVSEQNASGIGNAYAGGAAAALDASTVFSNPAGMSRLNGTQLALSASVIDSTVSFNNTQSSAAALQPTLGGNGGNAGGWNFIPAGYVVTEITPRTRFGLAINVPFGLPTNYDANWMGRFQSITSKVTAININPAVSIHLDDSWSVGAGVSYQKLDGQLVSAVNYSAAAGGGLGLGIEGTSNVTGSSNAWGYDMGVLFTPTPETRIGLAYRSQVKHTLTGTVTFAGRPAALAGGIPDGAISLQLTMPDSYSASLFHRLDTKWDLMFDATRTGWSAFQQLNIVRSSGATLSNTPENWKDTWRVSTGANYHYNETWTARAGIAFDQSPVSDQFRTASIPDGDRTWLALGGQYLLSKQAAIDFGYAHVFLKNVPISQNLAASGKGSLVGVYYSSANILSLQYTQNF